MALKAAWSRKHTIKIERAMFLYGTFAEAACQNGGDVFVITIDSDKAECQFYTDTRKGGLYMLYTGKEMLRPWEFSLERYSTYDKRRAAVEYTRRKLTKMMEA